MTRRVAAAIEVTIESAVLVVLTLGGIAVLYLAVFGPASRAPIWPG